MSTLIDLVGQYKADLAKLAELELDEDTLRDTLESLGGELEAKAQGVAHVIRTMEADAEAIKGWAKSATERAKAAEARAEWLKNYLSAALQHAGIQKINGPGVSVSFRKSTSVDVFDPAQLPSQFWNKPEPPPPAPAKVLIGDALKRGEDVPGAKLLTKQNLQIR